MSECVDSLNCIYDDPLAVLHDAGAVLIRVANTTRRFRARAFKTTFARCSTVDMR